MRIPILDVTISLIIPLFPEMTGFPKDNAKMREPDVVIWVKGRTTTSAALKKICRFSTGIYSAYNLMLLFSARAGTQGVRHGVRTKH